MRINRENANSGHCEWRVGKLNVKQFARKVNSLPLGILFGLAIGFVLAFLVASLQHGYYFRIILPSSIVGLIVGYATQRFGNRREAEQKI